MFITAFFFFIKKYICVYHSSVHERVQDYKILKVIWIFSIFVSVILMSLEFFFIHNIQSMTVYSGLRHHWNAKQEPIFYVNVIFILTILMYIYLQIRLLDRMS